VRRGDQPPEQPLEQPVPQDDGPAAFRASPTHSPAHPHSLQVQAAAEQSLAHPPQSQQPRL
jgi:hypothetical protein